MLLALAGLTSKCIPPESTEAEPGKGNCRDEGDQYEAAPGEPFVDLIQRGSGDVFCLGQVTFTYIRTTNLS